MATILQLAEEERTRQMSRRTNELHEAQMAEQDPTYPTHRTLQREDRFGFATVIVAILALAVSIFFSGADVIGSQARARDASIARESSAREAADDRLRARIVALESLATVNSARLDGISQNLTDVQGQIRSLANKADANGANAQRAVVLLEEVQRQLRELRNARSLNTSNRIDGAR